jgi:hypothetical protein
LFGFGKAGADFDLYAELFGCGQGQFPIRYLGIPIHYRRLTNDKWKVVKERLQFTLSSWKGKLLSLEGRLVLINPVLTNWLYMISFFQLTKWVLKNWFISNEDSSGKVIVKKTNIYRLNGVWSVARKIWEILSFKTLRSKIGPASANGYPSYFRRMVFGSHSLWESMLPKMCCLEFLGNLGIHISRLTFYGNEEILFSIWVFLC